MKQIVLSYLVPRTSYLYKMLLLLILACLPYGLSAQEAADKPVTLQMNSVTVKQFFAEVKKQTGLSFIYDAETAKAWPKVSINVKKKPAREAIEQVVSSIGCSYSIKNNIVTVTPQKLSGRERTIRGHVYDEQGQTLIGVPVCIGESRVCTVTDADGYYTFKIPVEKTSLKFSYVGLENEYVSIPAGTSDVTKDVTLKSSLFLDDVVVIGYGSMARKDLTGSVATVNPDELTKTPSITIDDALMGKAAGMQVTKADGSPGGAVRIRIRGGSSLQGGVDPLYIIDGIPTEIRNEYISTATDINNPLEWSSYGEQDMGSVSGSFMRGLNSLAGLNINDIESITVMKDGSATAIYGSKAANGVVIITTKRGLRDQKPTFNFSYSLGISNPIKEKVLNAKQYMGALEQAINTANTNMAANGVDERYINSNTALLERVQNGAKSAAAAAGFTGVDYVDTDWLDLVLRSGITHNADFSVSGGGKSSRYYTSFSYTNQEGTLIGTDFNRLTANVSMDNDITKRFRTYMKINASYAKNNMNGGVYNQALAAPPILPAYNSDGSYANYAAIGGVDAAYVGFQNPMAVASTTNRSKTYSFKGSIAGEYEIIKDLKFKSTISLSYNNYNQLNYVPSYVLAGGGYYGAADSEGGQGTQAQSTTIGTFWENTLTYNAIFNDIHAVNAVIGHEWDTEKQDYFSAKGKGYPDDDYLNNLSSAAIAAQVAGANPLYKSALLSFYGRVNYTLMDRYLFTFTGRSDTSSKFAKAHRTGFFPSGAIAWRISEEPFLKKAKWIDEIKIRASIGKTGTQNIGNWMFLSLYSPDSYAGKSAIAPTQLGNDDIKWESTLQRDLGLDFSFFRGRLSGTIAYYDKITDDALLSVTPAPSSGFGTVISNIAKINNKGMELELNGDFIRTKNWQWSGALNISRNTSKVEKLLDNQFSSATDRKALNLGTSLIREGESLGLLCGYKVDGLMTTQAQVDAFKETMPLWLSFFQDLGIGSPNFLLDETGFYYQDVIGNCTPDFYGGYTNTLRYKNWSLMAAFTFSYGNDLLYMRNVSDRSFNSLQNRGVAVLDASTPTHFTGNALSSYNSNGLLTDLDVFDASYLKLQTLSLAYSFDNRVLKPLGLTNLMLYATASNLFTITSYPGPDPAVSDNPYSLSGGGRDISSYPTVKSFSFGVRVGF